MNKIETTYINKGGTLEVKTSLGAIEFSWSLSSEDGSDYDPLNIKDTELYVQLTDGERDRIDDEITRLINNR